MNKFSDKAVILMLLSSLSYILRVSQKKGGLRFLNRFDSYCLKEHLDGSKLGKNMWNAFNMAWQYFILM